MLFPASVDASGYQVIEGSCSTYTTVGLFSGNLLCQVTPIDVPTVGMPLNFFMSYDSLQLNDLAYPWVVVGHGWRHNYMMSLSSDGEVAYFTNETGRVYYFNWVVDVDTQYWALSQYSPTIGARLTGGPDGSGNYRLTYLDGSYIAFNSAGALAELVDRHGNATSLTYSTHLDTVTDSTGRSITFTYDGSSLSTITDPMGNVTTLVRNADSQLIEVIGPEGCTTSFSYESPTVHRLRTRTDALGNTYRFRYSEDNFHRLVEVVDPEGNEVKYDYTSTTYNECLFDGRVEAEAFKATLVTDARGNVWEYRFDPFGNIWRIIDPLGHQRHYHYDTKQNKVFESNGFRLKGVSDYGPFDGPWTNLNNQYRRFTYHPNYLGQSILQYEIDATGMATAYTYSDIHPNQLLEVHPGQAHFGLGGNWVGQFGQDGWLLCAFDGTDNFEATGGSPATVGSPVDRKYLPPYIESVTHDDFVVLERHTDAKSDYLDDPRVPLAPDSLERSIGLWKAGSSGLHVTVAPKGHQSFNLTLYSHCAEFASYTKEPVSYGEQTGRALYFTVQDLKGTQTYRVDNTSSGVWISFPVTADRDHPVKVTVSGYDWQSSGVQDATISAIMFDPYYDRRIRYTYNSTSDVTRVEGSLGYQVEMTYNSDGTLATMSEIKDDGTALETQYFYEDTYKNLTSMVDATGKTSSMTYDINGNVLSMTDPNGNTTSFEYDARNRPVRVKDALGHPTNITYDLLGRPVEVLDALGNARMMSYTASGRLAAITDALARVRTLAYDPVGNLRYITDARNNVTTLDYDATNNLTSVLLPDGNRVMYAYDELGQLVAVTPPNGNRADADTIVTDGAMNWLRNPGAETLSPYAENGDASDAAQFWSVTNGFGRRLAASGYPVHSGIASFFLFPISDGGFSSRISQAQLPFPAGATGLVRAWGYISESAPRSSMIHGVTSRDFSGNANEVRSEPTELVPSTWVQTPAYRYTVDGDAQYARFPLTEYRLYVSVDNTPSVNLHAYLDDVEMYSLSQAVMRDGEKRVTATMSPHGASTQIVRDRYGRVARMVDALGNTWQTAYDSLDRPVFMLDPLGNATALEYDSVGNLVASSSARSAVRYSYDDMHRLTSMTYADDTSEEFAYDDGGRLVSYTNNRGQQRTYEYDALNRLTKLTYETDSSTVQFSYDVVGNVVSRVERNGDTVEYLYDDVYRVVRETMIPGTDSPTGVWTHEYRWDDNDNLLSFGGADARYNRATYNSATFEGRIWQAMGPSYDGAEFPDDPRYDLVHFDVDPFAVVDALYDTSHYDRDSLDYTTTSTDPGPRYDAMNRLRGVRDAAGHVITFGYDADGRRTSTTRPTGDVLTLASYDIVGRVTAINTSVAGASVLPVGYCYDLASNPLCITTDSDTIDYVYDDAGRLIEESHNRFTQRRFRDFRLGACVGVQPDPATETLSLLPVSDNFTDLLFDADRWRTVYNGGEAYVRLSYNGHPNTAVYLRTP